VCIIKLPTHILDVWKLHLHLSACKSIKTMLHNLVMQALLWLHMAWFSAIQFGAVQFGVSYSNLR